MGKRGVLHVPVLLNEVLGVIAPKPGQVIVDCTLGLGGHSSAILERLKPDGRLISIDLDKENLADARVKLQRVKGREGTVRFDLVQDNFANIVAVLERLGVASGGVDAVLADIGVASTQIDDPSRGFSYRKPGPLDMRMDPEQGEPAWAVLERMSEEEIVEALLTYGDETDAGKIAKLIVKRRERDPIRTTEQLMAIVCQARDFTITRAAGAKLHPAARTFQALRIIVNKELENLERLLASLPLVLKPGGTAAIITFHSGEDRRVKHSFRDLFRAGVYSEEEREPIVATEDERKKNPRARSAKLRWVRLAGAGGAGVERAGDGAGDGAG